MRWRVGRGLEVDGEKTAYKCSLFRSPKIPAREHDKHAKHLERTAYLYHHYQYFESFVQFKDQSRICYEGFQNFFADTRQNQPSVSFSSLGFGGDSDFRFYHGFIRYPLSVIDDGRISPALY